MISHAKANMIRSIASSLTVILFESCQSTPAPYTTGDLKGKPNIATCAKSNFPEVAKKYVREALVELKIKVDKKGIVRSAEPQRVLFKRNTDRNIAEQLTPHFERAGIESLLNRQCPIYYVDGEPKAYMLVVPLSYEFLN